MSVLPAKHVGSLSMDLVRRFYAGTIDQSLLDFFMHAFMQRERGYIMHWDVCFPKIYKDLMRSHPYCRITLAENKIKSALSEYRESVVNVWMRPWLTGKTYIIKVVFNNGVKQVTSRCKDETVKNGALLRASHLLRHVDANVCTYWIYVEETHSFMFLMGRPS